MKDEIWTMRDGTKIAVGDMDESHVRNALRMVIRVDRKRRMRALQKLVAKELTDRATCGGHEDYEFTVGEMQDELSNQAYDQLSNAGAFHPYLEGGKHGSPELAARHDPRKR